MNIVYIVESVHMGNGVVMGVYPNEQSAMDKTTNHEKMFLLDGWQSVSDGMHLVSLRVVKWDMDTQSHTIVYMSYFS